jgi:DNA-binding response OmpR family regulator
VLDSVGWIAPVSSDNSSRIFRFGVFEVDLSAGDLRRKGLKVKLQDQPLLVLAALLERPGETITREELRSKLWPAETFVDFDHGLNAAIKECATLWANQRRAPSLLKPSLDEDIASLAMLR